MERIEGELVIGAIFLFYLRRHFDVIDLYGGKGGISWEVRMDRKKAARLS
jgi:hypothetical protein